MNDELEILGFREDMVEAVGIASVKLNRVELLGTAPAAARSRAASERMDRKNARHLVLQANHVEAGRNECWTTVIRSVRRSP